QLEEGNGKSMDGRLVVDDEAVAALSVQCETGNLVLRKEMCVLNCLEGVRNKGVEHFPLFGLGTDDYSIDKVGLAPLSSLLLGKDIVQVVRRIEEVLFHGTVAVPEVQNEQCEHRKVQVRVPGKSNIEEDCGNQDGCQGQNCRILLLPKNAFLKAKYCQVGVCRPSQEKPE